MWKAGKIPEEWEKGLITLIYSQKLALMK